MNELTRDLQDAQHQLSLEKQGSKESETRLKQSIEERVSSKLIWAYSNLKNYGRKISFCQVNFQMHLLNLLTIHVSLQNHSVSKCHTEMDILRAERDKLDSLVMQHER